MAVRRELAGGKKARASDGTQYGRGLSHPCWQPHGILLGEGRHREEVDRYRGLEVILQEDSPGLRRRLTAPRHMLAHTGLANVDAELKQCAVDPRGAPSRSRPTETVAVPGNHRLRFHRTRADRQPFQNRDNRAQRNGSAAVRFGRFTERCKTLS